jgi:hypothetical protein
MGLAFQYHIFSCQVWARGCIIDSGLHLECLFKKKASASSGLIQNLELDYELFRGKSNFNDDLESLMLYLLEDAYKFIKKLSNHGLF